MCGLFKKKKVECPITNEKQDWIESAFKWLKNDFGENLFLHKRILTPHFDSFPIKYDGGKESAIATMKIVAEQMEVNPDEIFLNIYSEGAKHIDTGGSFGNRIYIDHEKDSKHSGGLYWGKDENDNKYHIGLEVEVLQDPEEIVATLAHEIAHIKLLGEGRLEENNEYLTDLTTIIFGLGIFNANCSFKFKSSFDSWRMKRLGYLSQIEWGFALALHAYLRGEENPDWIKYLSTDIKAAFKKSLRFISV